MISLCPHCGRSVATSEYLIHTERFGWVPTLCANGDGPLPDGTRERVTNAPYWYTSIINDRGEKSLLTGPFSDYDKAHADLSRAMREAESVDPWSAFYRFGIASSVTPRKTVFGVPV